MSVYIAKHEHGFYKIGMSKTPWRRVNTINYSCPYRIELLGTISPKNGTDSVLEKLLHSYYSPLQREGEWFDIPDEEMESLIELNEIDVRKLCETLGFKYDDIIAGDIYVDKLTYADRRTSIFSGSVIPDKKPDFEVMVLTQNDEIRRVNPSLIQLEDVNKNGKIKWPIEK